ncbi:MAG: sigma-70 family RNA polymerase sigma factor [Planctomycetes bacterium]|nr:sigma-70 family RNA polymerase sigma factor [Planctomycetota bacterium]
MTQLLADIKEGRASVSDELLPLVYEELRELARKLMKSRGRAHTLEPTSLVNEACAKLIGSAKLSVDSRVHFFALAALAMRQVLSNHARAVRGRRQSTPGQRTTLSGIPGSEREVDSLALDDALNKLATLSPRQARLVELRFFGGMTMEESAQVLDVSVPTLEREWRAARAFLRSELGGGDQS